MNVYGAEAYMGYIHVMIVVIVVVVVGLSLSLFCRCRCWQADRAILWASQTKSLSHVPTLVRNSDHKFFLTFLTPIKVSNSIFEKRYPGPEKEVLEVIFMSFLIDFAKIKLYDDKADTGST